MGSEAKALQTIVRRILGQVCSISSCEQNWSIYLFVHNKVHNRLQPSRAEDLVYIYTNNRLLRHQRGPNPIQWYGIHQIHSDNESDGEAQMEMTEVGIPTLTQIWLTTIILGVMHMDLTTLIEVIVLPMVSIQTSEVVAGLENTTMLVLSSMVVMAAAAVMVLEYLTFAREKTNHMLLRPYHLLMMNQGMPPNSNIQHC